MPGRKSAVSATSNGAEETAEVAPNKISKDRDGVSVEDLSLPKSMVARLAKGVLPANTQIHKDALLALHKSATVFVSYIASNSNDNAQASGKKTISPHDVTAALKDAELEGFLPRLEAELKKYNDTQCDKRNNYRRKVKEDKAAAVPPGEAEGQGDSSIGEANGEAGGEAAVEANGHAEAETTERPAKKMKAQNGDAVLPDPVSEDDEGDDDDAEDDDQDAHDSDGEASGDVSEEEGEDEESVIQMEVDEDSLEEAEDRRGLRDEALDEPDSD